MSSVDTRQETPATTLDVGLRLKVTELLQQENKIEAVKEVKTALGINLKDALVMVEEVERVINPNTKPIQARMSGCAGGVFKQMPYVFLFIGLALIAVSGVMYFFLNGIDCKR